VVQEVVGVALLARPALGGMVAVVDDQVQVPVTLLAVRGNLVCGIVGGVFAGDGKERLLGLGE
jgi:ribosomal protein L3